MSKPTENVAENTTESVADTTVEDTTEGKTTKPSKNTKEKTVKVMLERDPRVSGSEGDQEFFSVNSKNYIIKTDELVDVPESVAFLIENRNKARRAARKYAEKMAFRDSKPAT